MKVGHKVDGPAATPQRRDTGGTARGGRPRAATPAQKLVVADGYRVQRQRSAQVGEGAGVGVGGSGCPLKPLSYSPQCR